MKSREVLLIISVILLGVNSVKLGDITDTYAENIKIIESENTRLQEELLVANDKIEQYKNIINSINGIEVESNEYIYYDLPFAIWQQVYIQDVCSKHNISYSLVISLIKAESNFNQWAVSPSNCIGLMQVNNRYISTYMQIAGLENADPYIFSENIDMGVAYLAYIREYLKSIGYTIDEDLTFMILGCYNRGISGYLKYYKQTDDIHTTYADIILNYKTQLEINERLY